MAYIDDMLVYSKSEEAHEEHMKLVINLLKGHKLYGKLSTCQLWTTKVEFFGNVINNQGLAIDLGKVRAILD